MVSDHWFYQHGDAEKGPVSMSELESLAADGALTADSPVKHIDDHHWRSAVDLPELAIATEVVAFDDPDPSERPQHGKPRVLRMICFGLAALVIGAVGMWSLRGTLSASQDRNDLVLLSEIYAEFQQLRDSGTSEDEWDDFTKRTQQQIRPMLKRLEETATAKQPAKQALLWASRDYLRKMLEEGRNDPDAEIERTFLEHLSRARQLLN